MFIAACELVLLYGIRIRNLDTDKGSREKFGWDIHKDVAYGAGQFLTCARTREFDNQALDHTFFQLEHCKPLFKQQNILAFKNLYTYHTFMEVFKILKLRCPTSLNQHYQLSSRKQTALIAQLPSNDFISRSTKIWSTIAPKLKLFDFSYKISLAKSRLKKSLLKLQHAYNDSAWTSSDYDMMKLSFENNPLQKI